jgi:hypothetical protein
VAPHTDETANRANRTPRRGSRRGCAQREPTNSAAPEQLDSARWGTLPLQVPWTRSSARTGRTSSRQKSPRAGRATGGRFYPAGLSRITGAIALFTAFRVVSPMIQASRGNGIYRSHVRRRRTRGSCSRSPATGTVALPPRIVADRVTSCPRSASGAAALRSATSGYCLGVSWAVRSKAPAAAG